MCEIHKIEDLRQRVSQNFPDVEITEIQKEDIIGLTIVLQSKYGIFTINIQLKLEPLNSTLDRYKQALFRMDVDFTFPSGADWNHRLSEKDVSVFTHEYIHFLQDISTYVGLNNAYVYSEQIHGMVNYVYKHPYGPIKIPINLPYNFGNIDLNK